MGVPEEEKEKGVKSLFEDIMAKNSPRRHAGPGSWESSQTAEPKETHTKVHHN